MLPLLKVASSSPPFPSQLARLFSAMLPSPNYLASLLSSPHRPLPHANTQPRMRGSAQQTSEKKAFLQALASAPPPPRVARMTWVGATSGEWRMSSCQHQQQQQQQQSKFATALAVNGCRTHLCVLVQR